MNTNKSLQIWLIILCFMVLCMVLVGGITRLTGSGLSMTDWRPVTGLMPPLSVAEWEESFELYKDSPQFRQINFTMTLDEYKNIYWPEYFHRILGRLLGLIALLPFLYFLSRKSLNLTQVKQSLGVILLIGAQGLMGWYMVKSGLVDKPNVSHFRLAAHLSLAAIIFSLILWMYLGTIKVRAISIHKAIIFYILLIFIAQFIFGAFTAGLKAGYIYNTYPLMGGSWIPDDITSNAGIWHDIFNNPATIQFIHRWLAIFVFFEMIGLAIILLIKQHAKITILGISIISIQIILGIATLITNVNIWLASAHQINAFIMLGYFVYLYYATSISR